MSEDSYTNGLLPYRVTGEDLVKLIDSSARGRSMSQVQSFFSSQKNFEGTVTAAKLLGLMDDQEGLTKAGQRFALGSDDDKRITLRELILEYEPYALFLEVIFHDELPDETELDEVEKWWNINSFGNSQSNRNEGSSAFAQLLDYAGLGQYVRGRRGKATRIEWDKGELENLKRRHLGQLHESPVSDHPGTETPVYESNDGPAVRRKPSSALDEIAGNRVSLNLGGGRTAEIIVPPRLRAEEKERLKGLIDLLIETEDPGDTTLAGGEEERDTADAPEKES